MVPFYTEVISLPCLQKINVKHFCALRGHSLCLLPMYTVFMGNKLLSISVLQSIHLNICNHQAKNAYRDNLLNKFY